MAELIENIDIGGPTLIRAAAKNYQDVAVVASPDDYPAILQELHECNGQLSEPTLWRLAQKAFALTAAYDRAISTRLARVGGRKNPDCRRSSIFARRARSICATARIRTNPRRSTPVRGRNRRRRAIARQGAFLQQSGGSGRRLATDSGIRAAGFRHHQAHQSVRLRGGGTLAESYRRAFEADPVSAFGGVLAFNRILDEETAREIAKTFIEAIAAPDYEPGARSALAAKKNLRLLKVIRHLTSQW